MDRRTFAAWLLALLVPGACGTTGASGRELERVAKDWSLAIRASQVLPVYPLTEDLQPGDVLLVEAPIEEQVATYQERGFLPLDTLLTRLEPVIYPAFYSQRYGIDEANVPPRVWQFPAPADPPHPGWAIAPRAAFPTYGFTVDRRHGMRLALPVSGVPVGLGLLGARKASGTLAISDAYTFGTDLASMRELLDAWAAEHRELLARYAPTSVQAAEARVAGRHRGSWLRVVNRVYLAGRVEVALFATADVAGSAEAGLPAQGPASAEELQALNASLRGALPGAQALGGGLQMRMVSGRAIAFAETFDRPLVIGFLAFDVPILAGGELGPSVQTRDVLAGREPATFGEDEPSLRLQRWLEEPGNYERLVETLGAWGVDEDPATVVFAADRAGLRARLVRELDIP